MWIKTLDNLEVEIEYSDANLAPYSKGITGQRVNTNCVWIKVVKTGIDCNWMKTNHRCLISVKRILEKNSLQEALKKIL